MYGVVACPRCKRAKGVDLTQKTTTCACGFEIAVPRARVYARTDRIRELPPLVGRVNAELAGGGRAVRALAAPRKRPRIRQAHARVVALAARAGDRNARLRAAAVELTRELELFTLDDWTRVLEGLGIPDPEGRLADLEAAAAVFQPKEGFYRALSLSP